MRAAIHGIKAIKSIDRLAVKGERRNGMVGTVGNGVTIDDNEM